MFHDMYLANSTRSGSDRLSVLCSVHHPSLGPRDKRSFIWLPGEWKWTYSAWSNGCPWNRFVWLFCKQRTVLSSSSSSSFLFKAHEMSTSIQIKAGTTRQETALTVALRIHSIVFRKVLWIIFRDFCNSIFTCTVLMSNK